MISPSVEYTEVIVRRAVEAGPENVRSERFFGVPNPDAQRRRELRRLREALSHLAAAPDEIGVQEHALTLRSAVAALWRLRDGRSDEWQKAVSLLLGAFAELGQYPSTLNREGIEDLRNCLEAVLSESHGTAEQGKALRRAMRGAGLNPYAGVVFTSAPSEGAPLE